MKSFRQFLKETPQPEFFGGSDVEALTYCDLDGVLADFNAAASAAVGRKIGPLTKMNNADWRKIRAVEEFWSNMPVLASGRKLWRHIRKQKPFILSALPVSNRDWTVAGKRAWLAKHLPEVSNDRILLVDRKDKQKFAMSAGRRPNLLIDDNSKNIREWEAAGGIGILHRSETVDKTIARLKKLGY